MVEIYIKPFQLYHIPRFSVNRLIFCGAEVTIKTGGMFMKKLLAFFLSALFLMGVCACAKTPAEPEGAELKLTEQSYSDYKTDDNNRVFYEIFVGSFSDADGDGTGDLKGILNRIDYLNDGDPASGKSLGVEGIWLTPIFQSPSYHKYDVTDYYTIDPAFGTEEDLTALLEACHARNVKVILDLVLNHTGRLNEWFTKFCSAHKNGDAADAYYDFYTWRRESDPNPAGRTFQKIPGSDDYYECNFSGDMPELNFDNDAVKQAVLDVAKYYIDLGVDGFRFDAAKYVYFGDHAKSEAFWEWYLNELKAYKPDIYTVAEVWDGDGITDLYYPAVDCFNFTVSQASGLISETAKAGDVSTFAAYVDAYDEHVRALRADAMFHPFITNHDMDRAAGFLTVASGQMKAAANLYLLCPGSPFMYYGEELGLRGSRGSANTDANRRLAMPWGDGDKVKNPTGTTYADSKQIDTTALDQAADETSLYSYYKRLIQIRVNNPEIARGDYEALKFNNTKAGGFLSTWNGNTVCVLHNTTQSEITLDLSEATDLTFTALAAVIGVENTASLNGSTVTIGAQTSVVLR